MFYDFQGVFHCPIVECFGQDGSWMIEGSSAAASAQLQPHGQTQQQPQQQQHQPSQQSQRNQRRPKRTPHTWINSQIISASETGRLQQLLDTVQMHLPQMNMVNLSTSVHRLAKMASNDQSAQANLRRHPILSELQRSIFAVLSNSAAKEEPQTQSLSNVTWSLATLRLQNRPLVKKVAALATTHIRNFKPYELSTMLWAFGKLSQVDSVGHCADSFFQAATGVIKERVTEFEFRCLAMIVWAFATMKQRYAGVFHSIAQQMVKKLDTANCQEMANTAWAFGTVDILDERLFKELGDRSAPCLDDFKPQELSNMLWGFASNRCFHEGLFVKAAVEAKRMDQRNELQAQHLANLLWAFARVHPRHKTTRNVILALLPSCVRQIATFKPQELSSTAQAVAKAFGHGGAFMESERAKGGSADDQAPPQVLSFFNAALPYAAPNLHSFSEQSLANIVFAFSTVRIGGYDNVIFSAVEQEVLARVHSKRLDPRDMTRLIKGLSVAPSEYCGTALGALFNLVSCRVDELQQQELQVLSRICVARMGYRHNQDYLSREEIRSLCQNLSNMPCANAAEMSPPFCGNMAWFCIPMTAATAPATTARQVPDRPEGIWELPTTAVNDSPKAHNSESESTTDEEVASVNSSSAEDRQIVPLKPEGVWELPTKAPGIWETPTKPEGVWELPAKAIQVRTYTGDLESTTDEEIASVKSSEGTELSFGKTASELRWVCSVKNSFIHVKCTSVSGESAESTDVGDGEESWDGSQSTISTRVKLRRSSSSPALMESL
mmetsp:Transcript_53393/g.84894  ORF Transcript_53393/g.84894 Transcript_53393/m.84894 type:complete len:780 (-) Transcript_53393:165-2504(-)